MAGTNRVTRVNATPQLRQFPTLPPEAAGTRCDRCAWCWHQGAMRIKFMNRACATHGRYADADQ